MNYRYVPSFYYPDQKEVAAEEAPAPMQAPAVDEEDMLTAVEPEETVVPKEPVYSAYVDEKQVPLAYRMKYTMSAPSVEAQPGPVVEKKTSVVEQLSGSYFLRPFNIEAPVAPAALPVTLAPPVYKNKNEAASNYAWAEEVLPNYAYNTPYQSRSRVQEESTYVGLQNDVYAAHGEQSVSASYFMKPVPMSNRTQAASPACVTAKNASANGALKPAASSHSRFVSQVKVASLPQQSQKQSFDYNSVEGEAFRPVQLPQSEYLYGHLNDLASCINI